MILAKEAGDGGRPMARTARAAFTKSSPVPVWLQYFEKCSKLPALVFLQIITMFFAGRGCSQRRIKMTDVRYAKKEGIAKTNCSNIAQNFGSL